LRLRGGRSKPCRQAEQECCRDGPPCVSHQFSPFECSHERQASGPL